MARIGNNNEMVDGQLPRDKQANSGAVNDYIALAVAVEFGYMQCEKGSNLETALLKYRNIANQSIKQKKG